MLSIIIINYHAEKLLADCLQSLYGDIGGDDFEVIIVDNSPADGAKIIIQSSYPLTKWITMDYNAGFARANNAGIKASNGDAVLLLNADTIIRDHAVSGAYHFLMSSAYAACGVQLLNADGSPQISGNFVMTGGLNYLMQIPYIGAVLRQIALLTGTSKTNLPEAIKAVVDVDWINGAFLMVKKTAIEKAGMLDEDFFLYHEESEWCSRLKKTGNLCILGELHVTHLEGQSTNKAFKSNSIGHSTLSDRKGFQLMLSLFVRFRKEFGVGWFLFHLLFYTLSIPVVLLCGLLETVFTLSVYSWINSIGFTANTLRCWKYLSTIIADKPYFYKVL